jgi:hypothetical protein
MNHLLQWRYVVQNLGFAMSLENQQKLEQSVVDSIVELSEQLLLEVL